MRGSIRAETLQLYIAKGEGRPTLEVWGLCYWVSAVAVSVFGRAT